MVDRITENEELGFDPDTLRKKYQFERDKRMRADGSLQYQEVTGDFSDYIDDPHVDGITERDPFNDEVDVVIIGGGFGGLITAARFSELGINNIRIIEKGGDFGGTWYWNRYPGAACDTESYIYLPLLEELNFIPKEKYTHAPEILQHCRNIANHYDLYNRACLQTEVSNLKWDESTKRWIVYTNRGDAMQARFVVMSNGPMNRPKLPGIKGISDYQGHTFHTSRWDYPYTGGDSTGNLHKLKNKRVAVIAVSYTHLTLPTIYSV